MMLLRSILVGFVLILACCALATLVITRVIEARYPPQGRFVDVGRGQLHYIDIGPQAGAPQGTIVLLHGASSNAGDSMLALGSKLSTKYRVIAFDRPGHGWSDRIAGAKAASPAEQAVLVGDAMRKLGVSRAVVVGHSWSGAVVPNLALDHTDVTGAIMILSGVTHPWPGGAVSWYYAPATSWLGWLFTRTITTPLGALLMDRTTRAVFAPQEPPPGYVEAARIPVVLRPSVFQANAEDVAKLYEAVAAQSPRYPDILVPAVVIGGDADHIVWTDLHARSFAREVPGAKLIVLSGMGHMPHHAASELAVAEIDRLVANIAQRTLEAGIP
jgi:pimeloyl-ACP methyl ester carboxylesterase